MVHRRLFLLIEQMRCGNPDRAWGAVKELRTVGWLTDGSLAGADLRNASLAGADLRGANMDGIRYW